MGIGAPEVIIILTIVVTLGVSIWAAADASRQPAEGFATAGYSRTIWTILPPLGALVGGGLVGLIAAIVWFGRVKPRVVDAATRTMP